MSKKLEMVKCEECVCWQVEDNTCHRKAPSPRHRDSAAWPVTRGHEGCCQGKAKALTKVKKALRIPVPITRSK